MEESDKDFEPFNLDPSVIKGNCGFLRIGKKESEFVHGKQMKKRHQGTVVEETLTTTKIVKNTEKFPNIDKVIGTEKGRKTTASAEFNPELLIDLMKAFKGVKEVKVTISTPDNAMCVDAELPDGRKITGVIMPLARR